MKNSIAVTLFAIVLLSGCATTIKSSHKAYTGPDQPASQLALLKPLYGIIIDTIDGESHYVQTVSASEIEDAEISLLPGVHDVVVSFYTGTLEARYKEKIRFEAKAGHRYVVDSGVPIGIILGVPKWSPRIVDVTGAENDACWNVKPGPCAPLS